MLGTIALEDLDKSLFVTAPGHHLFSLYGKEQHKLAAKLLIFSSTDETM